MDNDDHTKSKYGQLELFLNFANNPAHYEELQAAIADIQRNPHEPEPYDRFFKAFFQLSLLEGIDYDTLFEAEEGPAYSEFAFRHVEKRKTVRPRQVILAVLGELLSEIGYDYIPDYPVDNKRALFRKVEGRFCCIVEFDTAYRGSVTIMLGTVDSYDRVHRLEYTSETELKRGLLEAWNQIIIKKLAELEPK